jgi:hypothetical protein
LELARRHPPRSPRAIFDFFSSYFNAWLDNQNLYGAKPKRWVVDHRASLARSRESRERFFATYPDGRLIAPVRDPRGWYASARRLRGERKRDLEAALREWLHAADETLDACERFPGRVLVVPFEQLVADTELVLGQVVWLGIDPDPALREPTFNRMPIKANSSFAVDRPGVRRETLTAWRSELTDDECARIEDLAGDTHRGLMATAGP